MTSALGARPATITGRTTLFPARLGEPKVRTLDQLVVATLDERRLRGVAPCLVCGESSAAEGACPSCGSELS